LRDFIKKKGIWIGIVAIVIALIAAVSAFAGFSNRDSVSGAANFAMGPFKSAASSVVGVFENIYSRMYAYDKLKAENDELKAKVAKYENEYRDYMELSQENSDLKALLGFSESHTDFTYEPALISSWSASNWSSSFVINKGANDGVELGDSVIDKNGYLVGRVSSLAETNSTVTTVVDTKSRISAGVYTNTDPAMAQGDFSLMREGKLKLMYLPQDSNIAREDIVLTAGSNSIPEGLIIGYVEDICLSVSGLDDYAIIKIAASLNGLKNVYVITEYEIVG